MRAPKCGYRALPESVLPSRGATLDPGLDARCGVPQVRHVCACSMISFAVFFVRFVDFQWYICCSSAFAL
jgi:hypothetical protein